MRNICYFLLIFFNFSIAEAEQKIVYIDIDYIIENSVAGKLISEHIFDLKNSKLNEFKAFEKNFKDKEKKLIAKKNIISDDKFKSEINSLNKELKNSDIKVCAIFPGGINTPLWKNTKYKPGNLKDSLYPKDIFKIIELMLKFGKKINFNEAVITPTIENF